MRTIIFTFIAINLAVADVAGMNLDDFQGSADGKFLPEKKIVKEWQINGDAFAQHGLDLRPNIVFPSGYFVEENDFQLGVPIHTDSTDKAEANYLHFSETASLPVNNQLQNWSGSFNDRSKQHSSLSVSGSREKARLQGFYGRLPMVTLDNLVYQYVSTRTSSSLILVGVGLISFGCLRNRTRRLEVVKV
ncbi:MAG: hypothetical protein V4732_05250 [Pseudomonadota bacterium]